ncbi:MAG: Txe/YoeB family addiction module toxin [Mangrovibacterium sp.]
MEIAFDEIALADLQFWKSSGNIIIQKRIQKLLTAIIETPYSGIGRPEALKYSLAGKWSRRINKEHRVVYSIHDKVIRVHSLRGHYKEK